MLALRLTRSAHPAVQLRRLLVAAASAGTGFLLLCTLGHALTHPGASTGSALRLGWCVIPLAATVHFALAVARTDPGTRPRPGLAAIGLGPARLMAVSATTTALATLLGSALALLLFLHLRGDLDGLPFDGAAAGFLAADVSLPLPATLTLLSLVPLAASLSVALMLRPRDTRLAAHAAAPRLFGGADGRRPADGPPTGTAGASRTGRTPQARAGEPLGPVEPAEAAEAVQAVHEAPAHLSEPPAPNATALPWGAALLAAGLAVEGYASRTASGADVPLPTGFPTGPAAVLLGWTLTAVGLALAGPGLTHLSGRLLQAVRPGALRLLAGRGLMEESTRIGRPLGVVCAVASGAYTMAALYDPADPSFGPLTTLGALVVAGSTLATLLTAAVEARQARAETTAALLRLGAPAKTLRSAAALRTGALLAVFVPLTLTVAELAALPLAQ
ncbi:hypothetical protein JCM4814A_30730 [Streptomyces phaeofaciens JCM 4814]|uniref:Uncharacterized protein n=1 Tax=Streptomyces phaeofaciens TaxID=68254 RepID=A0A918HK63_9ACTN|nr:hypothetical protein [Streptomyces phaeofaciens]GGT67387.1 hypothetical protein GCM10010226_51540 [Streptomyces phaeofaciens]